MEWKQAAGFAVGNRQVPIRSLRVQDEAGRIRRLRACTVWKPSEERFSRTPAVARLVKTPDGRIGALVSGKHQTYVKVGRNFIVRDRLIVPFNMLSKKAVRALLRRTSVTLEETDGVILAYDRSHDEPIDRTGSANTR